MIRLVLPSMLIMAAVCAAGVLFQDDFNDGDALGWHEASMVEFDVVDGMYRMYGGYEQNHGISFNGDLEGYMSVPDYSACCFLIPETGTFFGMMIRFRLDVGANIMLVLSLPHQALILFRWNWSGITLLDQTPFEALPGTGYRMRFESVGEIFRGKAWTGSEEPEDWMVSAVDTLSQPGSVALFCAGLSDVSLCCLFDDVVVTGSPSALECVSWGAVKAWAGAGPRGAAGQCDRVIFPL
jgi:hypothetical protein